MKATGGVSVIIRARDEAEELRRCLEVLRDQQDVGELETIYVDTGSTDGSRQVVTDAGARAIWIPPDRRFSFGDALNTGAANANGEVIVALLGPRDPPRQRLAGPGRRRAH